MSLQEKLFNVGCGCSVISWCVLGIWTDWGNLTIARVSVAVLNLLVGLLILCRSREKIAPGTMEIATSLGSLVSCGFLFKLAQPLDQWSLGVSIYFTFSAGLAVFAFAFLGRSFAVFPALREVKVNGPYRLVRHPAYLAEINMALACALASHSTLGWCVWVLAVGLTMYRISVEEKLLSRDESYTLYQTKVTNRLIPRVW